MHISPYDLTTQIINEAARLVNVTSVSIERDATDDTSLLESASITLETNLFNKGWYAIDVLDDGVRTRLGIFYFTVSSTELNENGLIVYELEGVSVLYNASVDYVTTGYSVVKGEDGVPIIESLLSDCNTKITVEPFSISELQTFDDSVTKLSACWSILRSAGMCMQITDYGEIQVKKIPTSAIKQIAKKERDLMGNISVSDDEVSYQCVLFGRPYDAVNVNLPDFGLIEKTFLIASQSISLETSLTSDETAKEQVYDE